MTHLDVLVAGTAPSKVQCVHLLGNENRRYRFNCLLIHRAQEVSVNNSANKVCSFTQCVIYVSKNSSALRSRVMYSIMTKNSWPKDPDCAPWWLFFSQRCHFRKIWVVFILLVYSTVLMFSDKFSFSEY